MTEPGSRLPLFLFLLAALVVAALGLLYRQWIVPPLRQQAEAVRGLEAEVRNLRNTVEAMRFEQEPGGALPGVLEHLRYWSGELVRHGSSVVERPRIEEHIGRGLRALEGLGKAAVPEMEAALRAERGEAGDELRRELLKAICRIDPERGARLAEAILRREEPAVTPHLRIVAADELLALDLARAGEVLADILRTEHHRGLRSPEHQGATFENPRFFNFVARFLRSTYPQKERVLLDVLYDPVHDLTTHLEVVNGLAQLGSEAAVDRIQHLFQEQVPPYTTATFRVRCAQAVVAILGGASCGWLRERLAVEQDPAVRRVLDGLIRDHCG